MDQIEPQDFAGLKGVALVTGGSGGLGSAVAIMLAKRGADVAITYRNNADRAAEVVAAIEATSRRGSAHQLAADDPEGAAALVEEVSADGLHTLVHAAGPLIPPEAPQPNQPERPHAPDDRRDRRVLQRGPARTPPPASQQGLDHRDHHRRNPPLSRARRPVRRRQGRREQLCWGLAAEEGRFGIRVNCVGPGMTTAGMAQDLTASGDLADADFAAATANIPLKRFGDAADIAEAVCFLASARAGLHLRPAPGGRRRLRRVTGTSEIGGVGSNSD
jgi:3-oxoacyl-[acyl-carrier protein] reductase